MIELHVVTESSAKQNHLTGIDLRAQMKQNAFSLGPRCARILLLASCLLFPSVGLATGVTIITHGFEADSTYPTWITAMADAIPQYARFPGTNFATYRVTMT